MYNQAAYGPVDVITGDYLAGTAQLPPGRWTFNDSYLDTNALGRGNPGQ